MDYSCVWEGLFRLACLLKSNPQDEPVAQMICQALADTEDGSFAGSVDEQICTARAALSVYEYNTDRAILKRIAVWLRYLEIEFDRLSVQGTFLYRPADLMELLIRYYRITGMKSILRLCTRLRVSAFDWTTALHTFKQSIPLQPGNDDVLQLSAKPADMDYNEKEKLINHAETLADGVRYTLYAGLFSGHGMDISSGRTVWAYLLKHHHALCGGTSANPFLCGSASDNYIDNRSLAAWTEAFASQLALSDSDWALDELIRIVFNGLEECINHSELFEKQQINTFGQTDESSSDPVTLYARISRAVSSVFEHAISLTLHGIRINYLIPCRILLQMQKQPVVLRISENTALFQCKNSFSCDISYYCSITDTSRISMIREGKKITREPANEQSRNGIRLHAQGKWQNQDGFIAEPGNEIIVEATHHHGVCFIGENRVFSLPVSNEQYSFAVYEIPVRQDGHTTVQLQPVGIWQIRNSQPGDIPVLPESAADPVQMELTPYSRTFRRITMFPRTNHACLK